MNPYLKMRIANKDKGGFRAENGTIWLYDAIASDDEEAIYCGGVSPRQFISELNDIAGPVTLRINSPGGSVFGAQAIVAAMRAHAAPILAQVDSLAASAASVIACEAASLEMAPGSMLMIHKAWGMAVGDSDVMLETSKLLTKVDGQIATTYSAKTGQTVDEIIALMAAETWFTAEEALAIGLADSVTERNNQRPQARWDLSAFRSTPKEIEEARQREDAQAAHDQEMRAHRRRQVEMIAKGI